MTNADRLAARIVLGLTLFALIYLVPRIAMGLLLSSDGTYHGIGLLGKVEGCNLRPAMFCAPCYAVRLAAGQPIAP